MVLSLRLVAEGDTHTHTHTHTHTKLGLRLRSSRLQRKMNINSFTVWIRDDTKVIIIYNH